MTITRSYWFIFLFFRYQETRLRYWNASVESYIDQYQWNISFWKRIVTPVNFTYKIFSFHKNISFNIFSYLFCDTLVHELNWKYRDLKKNFQIRFSRELTLKKNSLWFQMFDPPSTYFYCWSSYLECYSLHLHMHVNFLDINYFSFISFHSTKHFY